MKHIADVYGRALFPSRYAPHADRRVDPAGATLAPDGLELDIAAGVYRLVSVVEGLLERLRGRSRAAPAAVERATVPSTVGCG